MPRQPNYVTVPAVIRKADIATYAEMQGKCNSVAYEVNDVTYEPRKVRFATFAGGLVDGLYRGVYQFESGDWQDCEAVDLNRLPKDADKSSVKALAIENTKSTDHSEDI
jgi:hypothetical protein